MDKAQPGPDQGRVDGYRGGEKGTKMHSWWLHRSVEQKHTEQRHRWSKKKGVHRRDGSKPGNLGSTWEISGFRPTASRFGTRTQALEWLPWPSRDQFP